MILPDVNVLLNAYFREDGAGDLARMSLASAIESERLGLTFLSMTGFLRIGSQPRIFESARVPGVLCGYLDWLLDHSSVVIVSPGPRHWPLLKQLVSLNVTASNMISDAWLAAVALEHNARIISFDGDFARFPGLNWSHLQS